MNWAVYTGAAATTCTLLEDGAVYSTGAAPGVVIEPDFIGYLAQNGVDPTTFPAATSAAYTAGVLVHGADPEFSDIITGCVNAVNYLFHKNLPNACFGWEFALWGHPAGGWTTPSGTLGLMHLTDEPVPGDNSGANATRLGISQGRTVIYNDAAAETNPPGPGCASRCSARGWVTARPAPAIRRRTAAGGSPPRSTII